MVMPSLFTLATNILIMSYDGLHYHNHDKVKGEETQEAT